MSMLLVPYTYDMRLGQGFNSYTQKPCMFDAVVIDPSRPENAVTNDGLTMREQRASMERLSLRKEWQDTSNPAAANDAGGGKLATVREAARSLDPDSIFPGSYVSSTRGVSQIVTSTEKWVSKVSEITEAMNISGALSIKCGKLGGDVRGAFIDTEAFYNSDKTLHVSVKVVNQSINIRDPVIFEPTDEAMSSERFLEVFGDSFISGFLEGGEFNALVNYKSKGSKKKKNIQGQAGAGINLGPVEISGSAAGSTQEESLEDEFDISWQVDWVGGGELKAENARWTVDEIRAAGDRFPHLVARTPHRTYAILSKYETLRSFQTARPSGFIQRVYENASEYTRTLLEYFTQYQQIERTLRAEEEAILNGVKEFAPCRLIKYDAATPHIRSGPDDSPFEASLTGLDSAVQRCKRQIRRIKLEVESITQNPASIMQEDWEEVIQDPLRFKGRLPKVVPAPAARIDKAVGTDFSDGEDEEEATNDSEDEEGSTADNDEETGSETESEDNESAKTPVSKTNKDSLQDNADEVLSYKGAVVSLDLQLGREDKIEDLVIGEGPIGKGSRGFFFGIATLNLKVDCDFIDFVPRILNLEHKSEAEDKSDSSPGYALSMDKFQASKGGFIGLQTLEYSMFSVPKNMKGVQTGTLEFEPKEIRTWSIIRNVVMFPERFQGRCPDIIVWISGFMSTSLIGRENEDPRFGRIRWGDNRRLNACVAVHEVHTDGFYLEFSGSGCKKLSASWCAFDRSSSRIRGASMSGRADRIRGCSGVETFTYKFSKPPKVLIGAYEIEVNSRAPGSEWGIGCFPTVVKETEFCWEMCHDDHKSVGRIPHARFSYIAFEN